MEYFIKFSAILGLFYLCYKLFLEKETFFNSIRAYFLVGIIASTILPLVIIPEYVYVGSLVAEQTTTFSAADNPVIQPALDLTNILLRIYGLGILFFAIRFLMQLGSLAGFILRFPKKKQSNGYVYIEVDVSASPFSFFNYIVYPKNGFSQKELEQIMEHEKVHASHLHSLDIMMAQLLTIFNWFNPLAWMYQREIQKNLEFIADQGAQETISTKESYQYLLLKTVTPNYSLALTSNFYNSLIKKRINMLHKDKSGKMMYFKFMFILPLLVAFVFTFNTKIIAQQKTEEKVEWRSEVEVMVITKDDQKSDLEELKDKLAKHGITFSYKKLQYNNNNEIIGIRVMLSNKQNNKTQLEQMGSAPIKPISIKYDDKGALAVGNMEDMNDHNVFFRTSSGDEHKNVFVVKSGDSTARQGENFVWVSEDGDKTEVKVINGKTVTVSTTGDKDITENVWVTDSGDSTFVKKIKVIEIEEQENEGGKKVIVRKIDKDNEDVDITVEASEVGSKDDNKMVFISGDDGEKPLMIVDGKEIDGGRIDDIDPERIDNINVIKGDKAVEEYGDKAKNGVVIITTKK